MAEPLEIRIDTGECQGAGECVYRAAGTFALGSDGRSTVIDPRGDEPDVILGAARACPHFAITVMRGNERLV